MKTLALLMFLIPLTAHAGNWDLGIGKSDRQDYAVGWDYTVSQAAGLTAQYNIGLLYDYGVSHRLDSGINYGMGVPDSMKSSSVYYYSRKVGYGGVSLVYQTSDLYLSVGVIELTHQTPYLTSKYQFLDNFGLVFDAYRLGLRHISNGNTGGQNGGETMIYLSVNY